MVGVNRVLGEANVKLEQALIDRHLRQLEGLKRYARGAQPDFEPNLRSIEKAVKEAGKKKEKLRKFVQWKKLPRWHWINYVSEQTRNRFLAKVEAAQKENDRLLAALTRIKNKNQATETT